MIGNNHAVDSFEKKFDVEPVASADFVGSVGIFVATVEMNAMKIVKSVMNAEVVEFENSEWELPLHHLLSSVGLVLREELC